MPMEIGIVGGTRGMGRWLARLLAGEGYRVHAWGRSRKEEMEAKIQDCQVVFLSVPLNVLQEVVERIGPMVRVDGALMDLSSLKGEAMGGMLKWSFSEVVGLHPLFGPKVRSLKGKKVVVCRGRGERWLLWTKNLFEAKGAKVIEMDPGEHDWKMAKVQLLTHLNTMVMGVCLGQLGDSLGELLRVSTPAFEKRVQMLRKVLWENPELYSAIVAMNPHLAQVVRSYNEALGKIWRALSKGGQKELLCLLDDAREALEKGLPV